MSIRNYQKNKIKEEIEEEIENIQTNILKYGNRLNEITNDIDFLKHSIKQLYKCYPDEE